jgi:signal recognition particle receptor subunit beta
MVFFNWATMQMAAKIVYYGPGLCGKTTNLSFIYAKTAPGSRGEMVSLETETDRTLFFDLLPLEVGKVGGFRTRLQLYTVPGQVFYNTTRKLVLKGVDGVVFVADSQRPMAEANVESFKNLEENLAELGLDVATIPLVLQFNKRDLKNILPVVELGKALNPYSQWQHFESVAVNGTGVFETLKAVTKLTLKNLRRRMAAQESGRASPVAVPETAPAVSFSPAALSAAAAQGLEAEAVAPEPDGAAEAAVAVAAPAGPEDLAEPEVLPGEEALPAAQEAEEAEPALEEAEELTAEDDLLEEAEGAAAEEPAEEEVVADVEFATTPEQAPAAPAMRHVKLSSSLDILAELENVRKAATARPEPRNFPDGQPSLDLDALLRSSLNSRREIKRRIEENVGEALSRAEACRVLIQLVGPTGEAVGEVKPVEVALNRNEPLRQVALTLTVHLRSE